MRVRHRIAYNKEAISKEFINFLSTKNSKFEDTNSIIGVAYIFEDDECIDKLYSYYQKGKNHTDNWYYLHKRRVWESSMV